MSTVAQTLKQLGVTVVFGIVGIPIVDVGDSLISEGIKFISFRNEQSAAYAASAYGYLTGTPGVLLVVGGPGVIHALAGIYNANSNRWPLLVLAGSSGVHDTYKGGFQELDQISAMSSYTKFAARVQRVQDAPWLIQRAYKTAMFGTPGSCYIDLPSDVIECEQLAVVDIAQITKGMVPKSLPTPERLNKAAALIKASKSPLVIIGKGSSYADASQEIRGLIKSHKLPFLPTPMGKGVVRDDSEFNVSSARSQALQNADVVLLLGARLNWILHFGERPRFQKGVKFIHVDSNAEEIGNNASESIEYGLVGDLGLVASEIDSLLGDYVSPGISESIRATIQKNNKSLESKELLVTPQLHYNNVYKHIREIIAPIERDTIMITEGANTMDVARISFPHNYPKSRLDAGTNATMGVGLGYAIAAKVSNPAKHVISIQGDSAFGFSAMELETAVRSKLPIIVVVMNNSGIYHGVPHEFKGELPSTALSKDTNYGLLGESLGTHGFHVTNLETLVMSLKRALELSAQGDSSVLNVIIGPGSQKKIGFGWQNKAKL